MDGLVLSNFLTCFIFLTLQSLQDFAIRPTVTKVSGHMNRGI